MTVHKFGGASVKDAAGVRNVASIIRNGNFDDSIVVVSAMGKTTNQLEQVVDLFFAKKLYRDAITDSHDFHRQIISDLFPPSHGIFQILNDQFAEISDFLKTNKTGDYDFVYDQVVSKGELLSSKILHYYLLETGINSTWLDARQFIQTDSSFREGNVNWQNTEQSVQNIADGFYVTQGFIAADATGNTVTLGREGSDYSAAIFAFCKNADSMTIWKDVPGVMNGDPRKFQHTHLLQNISYREAIEMAYYGASVIHPKTLQPLQQKSIPFFVKSFLEPEKAGTRIGNFENLKTDESYILKEHQLLIKLSTKDFSFIAEEHLSHIFGELSRQKIKISMMQNSAISLALCLEDKYSNFETLISIFQKFYNIENLGKVALFTVRNLRGDNYKNMLDTRQILIEQSANNTVQMVLKTNE